MKRALKILLPLLLIAIVAAGIWAYFLIFRTDQTAQFYVQRAERAMETENYARAVKYYEKANKLNENEPEIVLALSEAYTANGNYTRAEYTLVSAISEDPARTDYYLALSSVYVKQGKLLDAEQMLSRIANEQAQAQIEALRPAAPTLSQESGTYNTLLELSLFYDSGTAYLTTDGTYPCLDDLYTAPVSLPAGTSEIVALVVADNGLVSHAAYGSFTIGRIIGPVTFTDPVFEDWARYILGVDEEAEITTDQLWAIQALYLPEGITSLADLQYFPDLSILSVQDLSDVDFSPLTELEQLKYLNLDGCSLDSAALQAIGTLTTLEELHLAGCGISNISSLSSLTALRYLDLSGNSIVSIEQLSGLNALQELYLGANAIGDVSVIGSLSALTVLDLSNNSFSDDSVLDGQTALTELYLSGCGISDLSFAANMPQLQILDLSGNNISDISVLAGCTQLRQLDLSDNQLTSIDVLASMTTLTHLYVDDNQLTELPFFNEKCMLQKLSATHNQLTDAAGVCDLLYLNYIDLDYNNLSNLDYLGYCPNLVQVNAFGNPISDVQALLDHSILVNYDPTYGTEYATSEE